MNIWSLSVKKPIFMFCVLVTILFAGYFSLKEMPVEMFPDVTLPIVTVTTVYKGAGVEEVENLVSKPIETELNTISGMKSLRSINRDSVSIVVAEFTLETDVKQAEQQVRDKVSVAKTKLPTAAEEPKILRLDPSAQPILILSMESNLEGTDLYDLLNEKIKPKFEGINQVGRVDLIGLRKKEVHVLLDQNKLNERELTSGRVSQALNGMGSNIPAGKNTQGSKETVFRTIAEFNTLEQIKNTIVSFYGNDIPIRLKDLGKVVEGMEDEQIRSFQNGKKVSLIYIYKQSGSNTVVVAKSVKKKIEEINQEYASETNPLKISVVRDLSKQVNENVFDVSESILIGIILTVLIVYLFLGSGRSTIITGLAIPFSLIGAMSFIYLSNITINIMSLLAFSLAVGLLIDDAIVVRENIFRHIQMGKKPIQAALEGTSEVGMAVVAVTLAILAVFAPIALISGVVGQFMRAFGISVCFVMIVSLFDALSNAPMLSAYFGGTHDDLDTLKPSWKKPLQAILIFSHRVQHSLDRTYKKILEMVLHFPGLVSLMIIFIVLALASTSKYLPKTFIPPADFGEFIVSVELQPGNNLDKTQEIALQVDEDIRKNKLVSYTTMTVGNTNNQSYQAEIYVKLIPFKKRAENTSQVKAQIKNMLIKYEKYKPKVKDIDFIGAGQRPFVVFVRGDNLKNITDTGEKLFEKLKANNSLLDPEYSENPGLPELQIIADQNLAAQFGVTPNLIGTELRSQIEGTVPAKLRQNGIEYDVRVRLKEEQRNLETYYKSAKVSNINGRVVSIKNFTTLKRTTGLSTINRDNSLRYVSIEADINPVGQGMGGAINDINHYFKSGEIKLPKGTSYKFVGQAENFLTLGPSVMFAGFLAVIFIYLVLASLYESFATPFVIMLVIPLALCGGFFGLWVMHSTLDLFSMIGSLMLMGLATKNSIILVDYIKIKADEGIPLKQAILEASTTRLRPILMTSFALVAGMIPVAIGLNEASSQRKSLGIVVIGGVLVSTILTLILIPAIYSNFERLRRWMIEHIGKKIINH